MERGPHLSHRGPRRVLILLLQFVLDEGASSLAVPVGALTVGDPTDTTKGEHLLQKKTLGSCS